MAGNIILKALMLCSLGVISQKGFSQPCISDEDGYIGWSTNGTITTVCSGNGIRFATKDQHLITPQFTNPLKLTFNKKRSADPTAWELKIQISTSQSGPWTDIATITEVFQNCSPNPEIDLSAFTGNFYLKFLDNRPSGEHHRFLDDIKINCRTGCIPVHSIQNFRPKTGPAATNVTIKGQNFNSISKVTFGGIKSDDFTVVNDSTIIAKVPANAPDGKISVFAGDCQASSINLFTVAHKRNCHNGKPPPNDLFISEIYHDLSNTYSFIEIFNGTPNSINLSSNQYKIIFETTEIPLTGTIASGGIFILKLGTGTGCSEITTQQTAGSALLPHSQIQLIKNTIPVDIVVTPDFSDGFRQLRLAESTAPNTIFIEADWISTDEPLCSHLGIAPYSASIYAASVTINTHPANVTGCTDIVSLSTYATGSSSLSYIWYYNNPAGMDDWGLVSTLSISPNYYEVTGAGTASITISGPTSSLQNYQFYADIRSGSPQCSTATVAATYQYPTKKHYRTVKSGVWSLEENWEMGNDLINWENVCNYPSIHNCESVLIQPGSEMVLDIKNGVPLTTVSEGAILKIKQESKLDIFNTAPGADYIIEGILHDSTTSTNSLGFQTGATWRMGNAATILKTNSGAVGAYRDNYEGGIANIPATGNWINRYIGKGYVAIATTGMYYPNLIIESVAGVYDPASGLARFTGSSATMTVKGNMDIGGAGSGSVKVYYENTNAFPFKIGGNLIIQSGSTLTNSGTNTGTGVNIKGNLHVDGTLLMNGGVSRKGVIEFSGSSAQTITGTGIIAIHDLAINNTGIVSVQKDLEVAGALTFGSGNARLSLSNSDIKLLSNEFGTARIGKIDNVNVLNNAGTGRFIVERYIPGHPKAWQLLSVPTVGSTIHESWQEGNAQGMNALDNAPEGPANHKPGHGITITSNRSTWQADGFDAFTAPGPSLKTFNSLNNNWVGVPGTHELISNSDAYMVFVRGDRSVVSHDAPSTAVTLKTRGFLKAPGIYAPTLIQVPVNQFILVGNPYASSIDYNALVASNLNDSYVIWDPQLTASGQSAYGLGGFRTISSSAGIAVPSGGNYTDGNIPSIQSGQAFFVQSDGISNGNLLFTEAVKVPGSAAIFKTAKFKAPEAQLRVNLHVANNQPILVDGTLLQFHNEYNIWQDNLDAVKIENGGENMGIKHLGKIFAIERRPQPSQGDTIFLFLSNLRSGRYSLELLPENLDAPGAIPQLNDLYTNTVTPLRNGRNLIEFLVNNNPSSYSSLRFFIDFGIRETDELPEIQLSGEVRGNGIILNWMITNEHKVIEYELEHSINKKDFQTLAARKGGLEEYLYFHQNAVSGSNYYRIKLIDAENRISFSEIIEVRKDVTEPGVRAYISSNGKIVVLINNHPEGKYKIDLYGADGKVIYSKVRNYSGGSASIELGKPAVSSGVYFLKITKPDGRKWIKKLVVK